METIEFTYYLDDIDTVAKNVLEHIESKTILFNGEMGAGKTTFIKALLKAMNGNDSVTSPTFSIVNEYIIPTDKVFHFDFYRIKSLDEAYNFGIEDYFNSDHWLFIEWGERVEELLPKDSQSITIIDLEENKRLLKLTINTNHLNKNKTMSVSKF